jgi:hypothetical protein
MWVDIDRDGHLDLFVCNYVEWSVEKDVNCSLDGKNKSYCTPERYKGQSSTLYHNKGDGSFENVTERAGLLDPAGKSLGVALIDYDNDGWMDLFISSLDGRKLLLKNDGLKNGDVHFTDVSRAAGLSNNTARTFTTWFWDYDNDGWLDILVCGYEFNRSLAWYAAAEALHQPVGNSGKMILFRNKHDGTFEDVSEKTGLHNIAFAMGGNFGDIDNDGWLDFYLGTGNPQYTSLVPNKLFKNIAGNRFADVTIAARVGNLQKGHGVSFVDIDNDGDQDIYIDMGGAYAGDAYENALYINPGQNNNHRALLSLQGTTCNRAAIGARLKISFTDNGVKRTIYRDVNSGGSFGSNPLLQHIGIGQATLLDEVVIQWPGNSKPQVFKQVPADAVINIKQDKPTFTITRLKKFDLNSITPGVIDCSPGKATAG